MDFDERLTAHKTFSRFSGSSKIKFMKESVEKIVSALADDKDAVEISENTNGNTTVIEVRVAENDMGRLIGRQGRTVKAIRSLLFYAGQKHGRRFNLNIVED